MRSERHTNALIHETSPYLKQHAHNPVDWHAWNADTLEKASREDKPLLISIGYAACHWCHVMAHESFEDEKTARLMNEHFICIKVDREERPDVDKYYMDAVQAMTGSGGWPLHAFALPDGRPFFGGTYFPTSQWQQLCLQAANEYTHSREKLITFANRLSEGESTFDREFSNPEDNSFNRDIIHLRVRQLQAFFDPHNGGLRGAPKFPMPTLVAFLLKFGALDLDENILSHVHLTLEKMAMGGIYDHIGGGFARYSTDPFWKIPHFEKMLYDNAQLLSLYSNGFRQFKSSLFKETVEGTAQFMLRDLRTNEGGFASSIDADSEGIEGKYYVWDIDELKKSLGDLFPTAQVIFNIYPQAAWEHNTYVLHRTSSLASATAILKIEMGELQERIQQIRRILYEKRDQREHPMLDHKVLTSWNGLAIQGLADAFTALHKPEYLQGAQDAADFVLTYTRMKDGGLFHSFTDGSARITGFLEDYSAMIGGLIALYQATFDEHRLYQARDLTTYCIDHFFDPQTDLFFFTSDQQKDALKREVELDDGVTPSSNSSSAHNLFALARYFDRGDWESISRGMILKMKDALAQNLSSYSNWASLYLSHAYPYFDTAISGPQAAAAAKEMKKDFHANVLFAGSSGKSNLPIFENRHQDNQTFIYVCRDKVCAAPVENTVEALKLISRS